MAIKNAIIFSGGGGVDISDADAVVANVLAGKTFYAVSGGKKTGTMSNRGEVDTDITTKAQVVTIAEGFHNGSGTVQISAAEQAKIIADNIKKDIAILGVTGTLEAGGGEWTKPAEWIDISTVGDNEINLLVTDGSGIAFATTVASSGTYTIDWGDGSAPETSRVSGTTYEHKYNWTGGTNCPNLGYMVYKIRIYDATANITQWQVKRHSYQTRVQYQNYLWAVFGTMGITTWANAFYDSAGLGCRCASLQSATIPILNGSTSYMFYYCYSLSSVALPTSWGSVSNTSYMFGYCHSLSSVALPTSWGSVSTTSYMFYNCYSLSSVALPTSWGSVSNTSYMFYNCYSLSSVALPTSWGSVSTTSYMFYNCYSLSSVALPTSWGSVSNTSSMFGYCYSLSSVALPTSWGSVSNTSYMFYNCYSLRTMTGLSTLGRESAATDMTDVLRDAQMLAGTLTIGAFCSKLGIFGASGHLLQCTGIRCTNTASTWGGSAPQVNVSYTSLDATALNTLFTDLVATAGGFSGKTINITGASGAATCDKTIITNSGGSVTG